MKNVTVTILAISISGCTNIDRNTNQLNNQQNTISTIGIKLPKSSAFPNGVDCEDTQTQEEYNQCRNYIFEQFGNLGIYDYVGRQLQYNKRIREDRVAQENKAAQKVAEDRVAQENKAAQKAATEAKWETGMQGYLQGVGVVPGAIVCPDYPTTEFMFHWYNRHDEETFQDMVLKGGWSEIHGKPTPSPPFERYGCVLAPNGTTVMMVRPKGKMVPTITGKLPSGKTFKGITLPSMYNIR